MPRYFFHVRTDDEIMEDLEGIEVASPELLESQCASAVRDIVKDAEFQDQILEHRFEVMDEFGRTVLIVPIRLPENI